MERKYSVIIITTVALATFVATMGVAEAKQHKAAPVHAKQGYIPGYSYYYGPYTGNYVWAYVPPATVAGYVQNNGNPPAEVPDYPRDNDNSYYWAERSEEAYSATEEYHSDNDKDYVQSHEYRLDDDEISYFNPGDTERHYVSNTYSKTTNYPLYFDE